MKKYWKNGVMKSSGELLIEYRHALRKKRDQMWLMFIGLRNEFDEIERGENNQLKFW
jgi:copper(I)-binding protein